MPWNTATSNRPRRIAGPFFGIVAYCACSLALVGCRQAANPWMDEWANLPPVSTPSAEVARSEAKEPILARRSHAAASVSAKDGSVSHTPLYYEDPTLQTASDDRRFAWTTDDYWQYLLGPSRFLANTVMCPYHAVLTPPWMLVTSHGMDHGQADRATVTP